MDVLWIHGWGTTSRIWEDAASLFFPEHAHHFVEFHHCRKMDDYVRTVGERILDTGASAVIGWSMGGMLAMQSLAHLAEKHRLDVEKLVLLSTTLRFTTSDLRTGWPAKVVSRMQRKLETEPRQVLADFWQTAFGIEAERMDDLDGNVSQSALSAGLDYLLTADLFPAWETLRESSVIRSLWIHGGNDPICPVGAVPGELVGETADEQTDESANGRVGKACMIIDNAGHAPFLTHPQLCYSRIGSFLNDH